MEFYHWVLDNSVYKQEPENKIRRNKMHRHSRQQITKNLTRPIAGLKKINRHPRPILITGKIQTPFKIALTVPNRPTKNNNAAHKTTRRPHGRLPNS